MLEVAGVVPNDWQGFDLRLGSDRWSMLEDSSPGLRACFESDLRWLKHYGFAALDVPTLHGGLSR